MKLNQNSYAWMIYFLRHTASIFPFVIFYSVIARAETAAEIFSDEVAQCNYFSQAPATFATYCLSDVCQSAASGHSTMFGQNEVNTSSLVAIGSHSKIITAILTLISIDKGNLHLDDTLASFFPEYAHWKGVTVRDLLQHTSGVPEYMFSEQGKQRTLLSFFNWSTRIWKPAELVGTVVKQPSLYPVGSKLEYNNTNYILLGMILEKVNKLPLAVILDREIVAPLGLNNTFVSLMDSEKYRLTSGYYPVDVPIPDWIINLLSKKIKKSGNYIDTTKSFDSSLLWSAGGMVSTTSDLAHIVRALLSGRLVSEDLLKEMKAFRDGSVLGFPLRYGLGLMTMPSPYGDMLGHAGMTPGYYSVSYYLPSNDSVLSVAQNIAPAQIFSIYYDLLDLVNRAFRGKTFVPDPLVSTEQLPADAMHLRVRGKLLREQSEPEIFPRGFGYTLIKQKLKTSEIFRRFSTFLAERQGRSVLLIRGAPGVDPYFKSFARESQIPFVELLIDREKLIASGSRFFPEGSGNEIIFAYRGQLKIDAKGQQSICVSDVSDRGRASSFQIDGQRDENFELGETVKFVGNIPMKTLTQDSIPDDLPASRRTICR